MSDISIEMGSIFIRNPKNLLSEHDIQTSIKNYEIFAPNGEITTKENNACISIPLIPNNQNTITERRILLQSTNQNIENTSILKIIQEGRDPLEQIQVPHSIKNPKNEVIQQGETRVFEMPFGTLTCDAEILISTKNGVHLPARYLHALRASNTIQINILNNQDDPISLSDITIDIILYKNDHKTKKITHLSPSQKQAILKGKGITLEDVVQFENNAQLCHGISQNLHHSEQRRIGQSSSSLHHMNSITTKWFILHKKQNLDEAGVVGETLSTLREGLKLTRSQGEILVTNVLPPSDMLAKYPDIKHYIIIPDRTDFTNTYHLQKKEINGNPAYILSNTDIKQSRIWQTLEKAKTDIPELDWVQNQYTEIFYDRLLAGRYFEKQLNDINRGGVLSENFIMQESNLNHIVSSLTSTIEFVKFLKKHKNENFSQLIENDIAKLRSTNLFEDNESSLSIFIKGCFLGFIDHDSGELQKGATKDSVDKKDGVQNTGDEDEVITAKEWIYLTRNEKLKNLQWILYNLFEEKRLVIKNNDIIDSSFLGNAIRYFDKYDSANKYTNAELLSNAWGMNYFETMLADIMNIQSITHATSNEILKLINDQVLIQKKDPNNELLNKFFTAIFNNAFKKLAITFPRIYELLNKEGRKRKNDRRNQINISKFFKIFSRNNFRICYRKNDKNYPK